MENSEFREEHDEDRTQGKELNETICCVEGCIRTGTIETVSGLMCEEHVKGGI